MSKKIKSLKDQILAANDLKSELVDVPEWGLSVRIQGMTGTERDAFETAVAEPAKNGNKDRSPSINMRNIRARLVAVTAIDNDGKLIFTDSDIVELGKKSSKALDRLFSVAQRLNGLTGEDVEELAKN